MKKAIIVAGLLLMFGCGPLVITTGMDYHPPKWFYPNRLELVRYVYFPEFNFYYDLSSHAYLYLDGGIWVRHRNLPPRYQNLDLNRHRYERVRNYREDNIKRYHEAHNADRGRSNKNTPKSN
ncbi:hypothetical protein [Maribacter polysaccharolyticus]|uniref:hypothetical protein n=1 Tax=Maribacter polysaccharolyticus TaxID=3020831 RepID=UPI00237F3A27|nr:hypothetical protein [Maribacter polysaccharolyticus]MDE3741981.1 hypothetical protein [Maribacter polysaccharolyticus]